MPRRKLTVADFPPEFMQAWQLAVAGKLSLDMGSVGQARNFIQRLYVFRKRLMEEAPEMATQFYTVDLRIHDELGNVITGKPTRVPAKAVIKPFQSDWKKQIAEQALSGVKENVDRPEGQQQPENLLVPVLPSESSVNLSHILESDATVAAPDNVSETLDNLGYGSGADQ